MIRNMILAAAGGLALAGCSAGAEKTAAEAAVTQFHQLLDQGRYSDIYAATAPDFRQATSEAQFTDLLQRVHALGNVRAANQSGWEVNYTGSGHMVTLHYTTQYAAAQAREDFIYRVAGGAAALVNYSVSSDGAGAGQAQAAPTDGAAAPPAQAEDPAGGPPSDGGDKPGGDASGK